jgi:HD-like signal output (HDOD) protein
MNAVPFQKITPDVINQKMEQLPSVPDVVMKLSQMLENPNVTAEELGRVIQLDPQFTGQMLRACNSAYYAIPREITSIKEAVTLLGNKALKSHVYTILSHKLLNQNVSGYGLSKGELWDSALTGAVYARSLAKHFKYVEPDTAFTVTVLRDIGKLLIHNYVGNIFNDLEHQATHDKKGFQHAEKKLLGYSHTELGEHIGKQWKFPARLLTCIRYHHDPENAPDHLSKDDIRLLSIVHLADALCMMTGHGVGNDALLYSINLEFLKKHGFNINNEVIQDFLLEALALQPEIQQLRDFVQTA